MSDAGRPVFVFSPYCPRSIGEQIVQTPFLTRLAARERADVVVVAPDESNHLLRALGVAADFDDVPLRANLGELASSLGRLRRRNARAAWQIRKRSIRTSMLAKAATRGRVYGYHGDLTGLFQRESIPFDTTIYLAELYLRLLGETLDDYSASLPREDAGHALIVPVGLTQIKRYPLEQYLEIAAELARERPVEFLVGPEMADEASFLRAAGYVAHQGPALPEVERLVTTASLVVSNDCGPAHFAQIRDIPRVTLFERSINWRHWHRPSPRGRVLRSPEPGAIAAITPREVLDAVAEVRAAEKIVARGSIADS